MENIISGEPIVEDGGEYGRPIEIMGHREIVMEQYRRCCVEGSKEMTKGGITTKIIKGVPVQVEIPNQLEIFSNCVETLQTTLIGDILDNKDIIKKLEKIENKLKEIDRLYVDQGKRLQINIREYEKKGQEIRWDKLKISYELKLLPFFRSKMAALTILLKELNYLSEGSAAGG